jgi:hypothetical protein
MKPAIAYQTNCFNVNAFDVVYVRFVPCKDQPFYLSVHLTKRFQQSQDCDNLKYDVSTPVVPPWLRRFH